MKKYLLILLAFLLVMNSVGVVFAAPADVFSDVPAQHWAYDAVKKLAQAGIVSGVNDGTFAGDKTITRYQMAQIVANAMTKVNKADAANKVLIDKLANEFANELSSLRERVTTLETKTNKLEAKSTFLIESESLFQYGVDNPPANQPKVSGNDQLALRERLYFRGQVNPSTTFESRLQTSIGNFGNKTSSVSSGNDIWVDRLNFTTIDAFGFDKVIWGRQGIVWGQGMLGYKSGSNDGITVSKKIGDFTDFKMGAYVVNPQPTDAVTNAGNTQELQFAALNFQINPTLKATTSYYNNNQSLAASASPYNYGYNASHGYDVSFAKTLGAFTLIGEYARTNLEKTVGNISSNSPKAYSFQITNAVNAPYLFYPDQRFLVDYKKVHTDAFSFAYRVAEKGAIPTGLGNSTGKALVSPFYKLNNVAVGCVDNIKGYFFTYENVVMEGVVLSLEYQNLKFTDTGAPYDKTYQISLQVVF